MVNEKEETSLEKLKISKMVEVYCESTGCIKSYLRLLITNYFKDEQDLNVVDSIIQTRFVYNVQI